MEVQTAVPHLAQGPGQRPENGLRRAGLASGVIEFGAQVPIGVVPLLLCLPKIIYRSGIAAGKIDFLKAQEIEPQIPHREIFLPEDACQLQDAQPFRRLERAGQPPRVAHAAQQQLGAKRGGAAEIAL